MLTCGTSTTADLLGVVNGNEQAVRAYLVAQGLSGNFGLFLYGFEYTQAGDVGIDINGVIWQYNGALPFVVPAGTTPAEPDYAPVTFSGVSQFDTVADALNFAGVAGLVGSTVPIEERGARFKVVLTSTVTPNGMDILQSTANALYSFKLALVAGTNFIDPYWVGASPSPAFDNADHYERAAEIIKGGLLAFHVNGRYEQSRSVGLPVGVSIDGYTGNRSFSGNFDDTVQFASQAGGTYVEDFLFFLNIDPQGDTENWVTQFPNNGSGSVKRVSVDGTDTNGINGFKFAGSYEFEELDGLKVGSMVRKPSGLYTDKVKVKSIHGRARANTTEYLVDILGLGDGYEVSTIASGYLTEGEQEWNIANITRGLRIGLVRGGEVSGLINGIHSIEGSLDVSLKNWHQEGGQIILVDSSVTIEECSLFNEAQTPTPIVLQSVNSPFGDRNKVKIKSCTFSMTPNRRGGLVGGKIDIQTHPSYDIEIEDSARLLTVSGNLSKRQFSGILVGDSGGVVYDAFKYYSHVLSDGCTISRERVSFNARLPSLDGSFTGIFSANVDAAYTFSGATGTYYYALQVLTDPVRNIGRNQTAAEASVAVTNGGGCPSLVVNYDSVDDSAVLLRLFRGTSPGSYDRVVNVPVVKIGKLIDSGGNVHGFSWDNRTAGPVGSLNSGLVGEAYISETNINVKSNGLKPTSGQWLAGDRVEKANPTIDGNDMLIDAYKRLTDGNGHVDGTDWATLYASTVSPAT